MWSTFTRGAGFCLRETAWHMEKLGCLLIGTSSYQEQVPTFTRVTPIHGRTPLIQESCFIAPNSSILGGVQLGNKVGVFYSTTIRGDIHDVNINDNTTIFDRCVVRCSTLRSTDIGSNVTIEPGCTITGCSIADDVFIGANSVVSEGARVESQSVLVPGSVVRKFAVVPSGELWGGVPAEKIRDLTDQELTDIRAMSLHANANSDVHKEATEKTHEDIDEERIVLEQWGILEKSRVAVRAPYGQYDQGPVGTGTHLNIPGQLATEGGTRVA
eukprot:TRINITY_DN2199_c2_g1_i1.p1 TRINITY_DN2199_c2_g1~~TRINITY_DN2199_c2_g1_i1.p1  ORF type:complete len:271 (+),score=46.97 TRINITY_DN2199_c2_g1_i1:142-954(+)